MAKTVKPLVVERTYNAPPERIWQALTDPEQMKKWYFDLPGFRAEVGYQFQFEGGTPEKTYLHLCEVKEVVPNQRLAYSWCYDGYLGDTLVTFELLRQPNGKTLLRLTHQGLETLLLNNNPDFATKDFKMGWTAFLKTELANYLKALPMLTITRTLDAPRDLVFKVWTEPQHLAKWWGPAGMDIEVLRFELRPGGIFHYAMRPPNGTAMYGRMSYREITAPERLAWVNSFADAAGNAVPAPFPGNFPMEIFNQITLTEKDGRTKMVLTGCPINASKVEVDFYHSMFEHMNKGFGGTFGQLEAYLKTL